MTIVADTAPIHYLILIDEIEVLFYAAKENRRWRN
jgi:hypothetical protein